MKTISISISDLEYQQFGIKNDQFSFSEFVDIINKEITKQTLNRSILLAEKYKISRMSMDEITEEVKAVRNAKNNH
jgi:predicted CopG family antitoxin